MILYLSNFLSAHGRTPQPCEFIVERLQKDYLIVSKSSKNNILNRAFDEISALFRYRSAIQLVIIDLYAYKSYYLAFLCGFCCRILGLTYITVLHSHQLTGKFNRNSGALNSFLWHAKLSVAPSSFFAKILESRKLPFRIIRNPIDLTLYPPKKITSDIPRMLWVRTIHEKYNPTLAIKVLKKVSETFPGSSLTMVGPCLEPSYSNCLQLIQEYGLKEQVTFTGYLQKKEWIQMADLHNVFINTTNLDNAPVSMVEAAALGLPLVSTNVGGIPELFENNMEALLVNPDDVNAFSNAVLSLFKYPLRSQSLIENARKKSTQMSWEHVKKDWELLFKEEGIKPIRTIS